MLKEEIQNGSTRQTQRKASYQSIRRFLDKPINDENESNLIDIIPSDFDTFEEVMKVQDKEQFQKKIKEYIASLSSRQVNILNLLIDGYEAKDIQKILEIPEKEYTSHLKDMRSYEKVKSLF